MSVVEVFRREFKDFRIDIENWELCSRGITVLWGPSGSGKSTILKGLVGLDPQCQLVWRWEDGDLAQKKTGQRKLGVVFQDRALFPHLSVRDNILFPVKDLRSGDWKEDFKKLYKCLEISHLLDRSVGRLSGGEAQRVSLARALIMRPRMLLLDEPFSSLDEHLRSSAREILGFLNQQWHCPVLLITHDREDVRALAHRVTHLCEGRIQDSVQNL